MKKELVRFGEKYINMKLTPPPQEFINSFVTKINNGDAAIFAGAGLSASLGFVNRKGLLKDLAEELNLQIDKEHDLIRNKNLNILILN